MIKNQKFFEKIELGNFGDQLLRYKLKDFAIKDANGADNTESFFEEDEYLFFIIKKSCFLKIVTKTISETMFQN